MKNKLLALILVICLATGLVGCGQRHEQDLAEDKARSIDFVLDWTPNTNHIGVYVARDLGYYEDMNIDLTIVQPPEDGPELLLGAGKADIGVSFQDSLAYIYGSDKDLPLTAIGAILQHNTSGIMSAKAKDITRPKDMEGHRHASSNWQMSLAIVEEVVTSDGGDWSQVDLVPLSATDEISTLQGDLADTIWVYYGWGAIGAEMAGLDINYFSFKDIDQTFDYYTPVFIANNSFLEENPDLVKDFLKATKKGYEYAIQNPQAASQILVQADPALDMAMVERSIGYLTDYYILEDRPWGHMDQERWDRFFDWAYDKGLIENKIDPGYGMTNAYLP